jgi:hypothetical protein
LTGAFSCGEGFFEEMSSANDTETTKPSWENANLLDGKSLNFDPNFDAGAPKLITDGTSLYIIWIENLTLYLRVYNNDNSDWGAPIFITPTSSLYIFCAGAILGSNLYIAFQKNSVNSVWVLEFNLSTMVPGSEIKPGFDGKQPNLFVLEDNIFLAYHGITPAPENRIFVYTKKNGDPGWSDVGNDGTIGINDNINNCTNPHLSAKDGQLHVAFQDDTTHKIKMRYFDYPATSTWITVLPNISANGTTNFISLTSIVNLNGDLILSWTESNGGPQTISIFKYTGDGDNYLSSFYRYYNANPDSIFSGKLGVINKKLYHIWTENDTTISGQLRARIYVDNYDNDQYTGWQMVDGNNYHGLNYDTTKNVAGDLSTVVFNNKIYVAFLEDDGVKIQLRVKSGE